MAVETLPIPVKIQCACGQRYAFDVEPIAGRMPAPVSCPVCGADGTASANTILAQRFQAQPAAPATSPQPPPTNAPTRIPSISAAAASPAPPTATPPSVQRVSVSSTQSVRVSAVASASAPVTVGSITVSSPSHSAPSHAAPTPAERPRLHGQLNHEQAIREARSKIMWGDDPAEVAKFLMGHGFNRDESQTAIEPLLVERKEAVRKAGLNKIFTGIGMMCVPVIAGFLFLQMPIFPLKLFGATVAVGLWGAYRVLGGTMMFLSPKGEKGDVADM
jgi:hypothetical protein